MKRLTLSLAVVAAALSGCTAQAATAAPAPVPLSREQSALFPSAWMLCWDVPDIATRGGWRTVSGSLATLPSTAWSPDGQPAYLNARSGAACQSGQHPPLSVYVPANGDPNECQRLMVEASRRGSPLDACKVTQ